ncbi:MAG: Gfo/Idh/MocA family oxidoreductase [Planctomycetota bacterium]
MSNRHSRRSFLKLSTAAGLAIPAASCALTSKEVRFVSGRVRHAGIGVGGMGAADLRQISSHPNVDVVALCDVDENKLKAAAELHPDARLYRDWRKMMEREDGRIDSVHVTTPDHMHAAITVTALRRGLHVYCQKPLTHNVIEARRVAQVASRAGVVTQMGIQNRSGVPYRRAFDILRSGIIGRVSAVHVWTDRPAGWWAQDVPRPEGEDPIPEALDWDLWLGVAPERPYKGGYHPFSWRGWMDFGTGAQGDMACHLMDPALWFLGLGSPTELWSEGPAPNGETFPAWSTVKYRFPATRFTAPEGATVTWYDGGKKARDYVLDRYDAGDVWPNACLFEGEAGALLASPYNAPRLLPESDFPQLPPAALEPINHWHQWVDACSGLGRASAPFDYSGLLTEVALLGNVALRFPGERLAWDARRLRFGNLSAANAFLGRKYRAGWGVRGLG